jgi:hypothetical protein
MTYSFFETKVKIKYFSIVLFGKIRPKHKTYLE